MRDWLTILLRLRSPMICCLPDEGFKKPVESQFKFYSLRIRVANDVSPSLSLVVQEPCVQMSQGRRRRMHQLKQVSSPTRLGEGDLADSVYGFNANPFQKQPSGARFSPVSSTHKINHHTLPSGFLSPSPFLSISMATIQSKSIPILTPGPFGPIS